ncbi:hypothetical protein GCM10011500_45510 [Mucilaginibacter rubeus]|jgi:ferritin-like metal-binding protein YciE|nr:hypothetical protein GCM10011500_45510 [Mucilaginibacter rubeus]
MLLYAVHILVNTGNHNAGWFIINIDVVGKRKKEKGEQHKAGEQKVNALDALQHDIKNYKGKYKCFAYWRSTNLIAISLALNDNYLMYIYLYLNNCQMPRISEQNPEDVKFENVHLKRIFLEHLNSIYFGKKHLIDFFEEIKELASLAYLKEAVQECYEATQKQLTHLDSIYSAINETPSKTTVLGIKAMTLEAYISAIKTGKTAMERDVFIVFYVQIIEGIEITYFDVLRNLAKTIGYSNSFINKPFNLAVKNKLAFEAIYKAYITEPA